MALLPPIAFALTGTSLTTGRYSASWRAQLNHDLREQPEAKGLEIKVYDLGHGGWTSTDILNNIQALVNLKPTHALIDTGSINDCFDGGSGPAVNRTVHGTNTISSINALKAGVPGIDITLQTMSPVSTIIASGRPTLSDYYADDLAIAAAQSVRSLDNYAGWPKPLDPFLSNGAVLRQYPLPTGFSDWTAIPAFDPAAKNSNVTLSSNNQEASSSALHCGVRGLISYNSGKYYFEIVSNLTLAGTMVGIETSAASLANGSYVGFDAFGYGYYSQNGGVWNSGSSSAYGPTWNIAGAVIGVAVDLTAHKIWFSKNGVWGSGDPSAGTGGVTITAGTYFPAVSLSAGDDVSRYPFMGDGLHPNWAGAVDTYLYPNVLTWARARMAAFWP